MLAAYADTGGPILEYFYQSGVKSFQQTIAKCGTRNR